MKMTFIELKKENGDTYFVDLREISHIAEQTGTVIIYFKNGCKEGFASASYDELKKLLLEIAG